MNQDINDTYSYEHRTTTKEKSFESADQSCLDPTLIKKDQDPGK